MVRKGGRVTFSTVPPRQMVKFSAGPRFPRDALPVMTQGVGGREKEENRK